MSTQHNDQRNLDAVFLSAKEHRTMPWKNGLGVTTEIALFPADANLTDFEWRVSMATVSADGPFSTFEGIDRTLAVLSGDGLRISVQGREPREVSKSTAPYSFPADAPTKAVLLGRPVIDLNVMTRRSRWSHQVTQIDGNDLPKHWLPKTSVSLWFCITGSVTCHDNSALAVQLYEHDALLIQKPAGEPISVSAENDTRLFLIELHNDGIV